MAEILPEVETFARIKVIGIGGGGTSAVERMIKSKVQGVEFVAINTDAQALHYSHAPRKVHIGKQTTRGLGAGADPAVGRKAAEESEEEIIGMLKGADMVFITIGAGGGTGSGAAPLVAAAARETGALVVGIATRPFTFEGERRKRNADAAIAELKDNVDTLITIPNDRLLQMIDRKTSLLDAFSVVDEVLQQGVQGISDLITIHGLINLDFADIRAIMASAGSALMGIGRASGENRAIEAARQAIDSPLLEVSIDGAKGVLFNITGGRNMTMHEIDEAAKTITDAVDPDANIIFGAVLDETLDDAIKITVVATGFDGKPREPVALATNFQNEVVQAERKPFINEAPRPYAEPEPVMAPAPMVTSVPPKRSFFSGRASQDPAPIVVPEPEPQAPEQSAYAQHRAEHESTPTRESYALGDTSVVKDYYTSDQEDYPSQPVEDNHTHQNATAEASRRLPQDVFSAPSNDGDDLDIPAFIRRKID
jgi:cell division protein FtsZ